jgi:hypothetical protein
MLLGNIPYLIHLADSFHHRLTTGIHAWRLEIEFFQAADGAGPCAAFGSDVVCCPTGLESFVRIAGKVKGSSSSRLDLLRFGGRHGHHTNYGATTSRKTGAQILDVEAGRYAGGVLSLEE